MCDCKNDIAEINAKLAYIIETVEGTVGMLSQHPMLKMMLK